MTPITSLREEAEPIHPRAVLCWDECAELAVGGKRCTKQCAIVTIPPMDAAQPPAPCPSLGRCTYPNCGHFLDVIPSHPEYRSSGEKPCCGFPVGGPCPDCPAAAGVTVSDCTEPNRAACPRRCIDFCNKAEEAAAGVKGTPALPTTEELESLWETTHYGHPADFGADVLERWGGWMPGLLGHGGALQEAVKLQAQRNAGVALPFSPSAGEPSQ